MERNDIAKMLKWLDKISVLKAKAFHSRRVNTTVLLSFLRALGAEWPLLVIGTEAGVMPRELPDPVELGDILLHPRVIFLQTSKSAVILTMKQEGMLLICNCSGYFPAALSAGPSV